MPKCIRCKKEQPVLKSCATPEARAKMIGEALCDDCFNQVATPEEKARAKEKTA